MSQELNNSAELELEDQQEQRVLHMDELTAKIDKVLTHQHELIAMVRKASKQNILPLTSKKEELGPFKHDISSNAVGHLPAFKCLLERKSMHQF
ncbi:PREDICTED: uncharacterized protein LOC108972336 [Bactrocera latifrons]|uniref:uncharacterized protein LOC108972336 n=1 Tax=Bactrocera latifrons TaxID=174628 RepID=UPI0008DDC3AF|nr:PREDICTED: uncharacterized protein LOC108972336 [Bactrocera latifrons]